MTGYGRATATHKEKTITIEIRSLNSKFTDIRFKFPANYKEKEPFLRKYITQKVERGKIDVTIDVKSFQGDEAFSLNVPLFKKYYLELSHLAKELGMPPGDLMQAILRIPSVIGGIEEEIEPEEWACVEKTLDEALEKFETYRKAEGAAMESDLRLRIANILDCLKNLNPFEKDRILALRNRLRQNLEEFLGSENIDENRFEQEILFYLEKIDITEEKVRLEQHCNYFLEQLDKPTTLKGRKLSFISQEMGREINTMGAKAYSSEIQKLVVQMKDELEKVKEQVANSL